MKHLARLKKFEEDRPSSSKFRPLKPAKPMIRRVGGSLKEDKKRFVRR
jgi:hypothetical protein